MDTVLQIGGIVIIPLIIVLVNITKQIATDWHGNAWRAMALGLGVVASVVASLIRGVPTDLQGWATLIVVGLAFGASAFVSYQEANKG